MEAKESLYNGHLSDYSEDFEEEEESEVRAAAKPPAASQKTPVTDPELFRRSTMSHSVARKHTGSKNKGLSNKTRAFSDIKRFSLGSKLTPTPKKWAQGKLSVGLSPRDRMLSAKNHALRALQNELADAKRQLGEMKKENRLLNRLQVRQERELDRFQGEEGELPQLLIRHAEDVRVLKEQLRRSQEASQAHQQKVNNLREELLRTQDRKRKLEEVAKKRRLLEREALTVQLQQARDGVEEKTKQVTDLQRGMEVMSKNHAQEVRTLLHKNRVLTLEAEGLRETTKRVQSQLKEKEKEIDVMNIYSQRKQKSMPRPPPKQQAPPTSTSESQTELSCPPFKAVSLQTKRQLRTASSQTSLETPSPHRQRTKKLVPAETQTEISTRIEETDSSPSRGAHVGADKTSGASVKESPQLISETLQPRKAAYSPDSRARTVATDHTAPSNETDKGKLATLSSNQKDDSSKAAVDEERQKKDLLLARLRALDGQKGPPGSEPVRIGGLVKSSAEPTTNEPVDLSHPGAVAPTGGSGASKPTATATMQRQVTLKRANAVTTQGGDGSSAEAEAKKKLLLAKLMAIDEGKDPIKAVANQKDSAKEPAKPDATLKSSATHSDSSLTSWPDKIENMHQGKPAYSSDGDPFGSRHSLSVTKESVKADSSAVTTESEKETKPKFGRRQPSQKPVASSMFGGGPVKSELQAGAEKKPSSYKPSLVRRRAGNAASNPTRNGTIFGGLDLETENKDTLNTTTGALHTNTASDSRPIAGRSRDYPWETHVDISSKSSEPVLSRLESNKKTGVTSIAKGPLSSAAQIFSGGLGSGHTSATGSRPLLPLRPKAEPVAVSSFEPMPGSVIGEPDDIEEIVL